MGLGTENLAGAGEGWEVRGAIPITTRQLIPQAQAVKEVLEARETLGGNLYSRLFNQLQPLGQSYQLAKGITQGLINLCSFTVPQIPLPFL